MRAVSRCPVPLIVSSVFIQNALEAWQGRLGELLRSQATPLSLIDIPACPASDRPDRHV